MPWFIYISLGAVSLLIIGIIFIFAIPAAGIWSRAKTASEDKQKRAEWQNRLSKKEYELPAELFILRRKLAADYNIRMNRTESDFDKEAYLNDYKNLEAKLISLWEAQEETEYSRDLFLPDCRECSLPFLKRNELLKERMIFLKQLNAIIDSFLNQEYKKEVPIALIENNPLTKEEINQKWEKYRRGKTLYYYAGNHTKALINYVSHDLFNLIGET